MTIKDQGQHGFMTSHPRFLRFIGCCLEPEDLKRIYILSDFALGANLKVEGGRERPACSL